MTIERKGGEFTLTGKVAVTIGGTGDIGRAISRGLAEAGADVIPTSRSKEKVKVAVEEIKQIGRDSFEFPVSITDRDGLCELRRIACDKFGKVDILVNAAGAIVRKPAEEVTEDEWDRVLDVLLKGPFLASQVFGKSMIETGGGSIINIASMTSYLGMENISSYCASKGGILQLTKALAREWATYNIRVNGIAPGFFFTSQTQEVLKEGHPWRRKIEERTPMGRIGEVDELAGAAIYLASDAASFVTGETIAVDGGYLYSGL